jgi:hypothetical protein
MNAARRFLFWIRRVLSRSERLQMWYLERDQASLHHAYRREMAEARKPGGQGDPDEIQARYASEDSLSREELEGIRTERLVRRARQLRVPLPSSRPSGHNDNDADENWDHGYMMGQWTLTNEGEGRLRRSIRDEEKARRETAASWLGIVSVPIAVLTALIGATTGLIAIQQKELSRLDHLPRIGCSISIPLDGADQESLIVANTGSPVRTMSVDRLAFFDAQPNRPGHDAKLMRYLLDDYYRDQLGGDYEGNQRMAFGLQGPRGNIPFVNALTASVVDSLSSHQLAWAGIEVYRVVRVAYRDWLGTRMVAFFEGTSRAIEPGGSMERISDRRWRQLASAADSLRKTGHSLRCVTMNRDSVIRSVALECIDAALR